MGPIERPTNMAWSALIVLESLRHAEPCVLGSVSNQGESCKATNLMVASNPGFHFEVSAAV